MGEQGAFLKNGGCYSVLITPFEEDGRIDYFAFERLLCYQRQAGASGVAIGFWEGEAGALSTEEYRHLLSLAVCCLSGKVPVVASCFALSTGEALKLGEMAYDVGVDALYCPPPFGITSVSPGYFSHLRTLSEHLSLPLICARSGGKSALGLCLEQIVIKGVAGVAEKGESLLESTLLKRDIRKVPLFCTKDELLYPSLTLGFDGAFSPLSCLYPEALSRLFGLCARGELQKGCLLFEALAPLISMMKGQDRCALLKWGLHRKGLCTPALRLPLTLPCDATLKSFEKACVDFEREIRLCP